MEVEPEDLLQAFAPMLPAGAGLAELGALEDASPLFEEERSQIASAINKRQREFRAGRCCARRALAQLGVQACAISAGPDRAPVWPTGVVGSISHCEGYAVAVVARSETCRGIGVDVESRGRVGARIWRRIATELERETLSRLAPEAAREHATRLFGAKEAFYKAQYQITRGWVGFQDAAVELEGSAFALRLLVDVAGLAAQGAVFRGEQRLAGGRLLSLLWLS